MIKLTDNYKIEESIIYIIESKEQLDNLQLNNDEKEYALKKFESEKDFVFINSFFKFNFIIFVKNEKDINSLKENLRKKSDKIIKILDEEKIETINILDISQNNYELVLAEALALNCYDFTKYFNESDKKKHSLKEIKIISTKDNENKIFNLNALIEGVFHARDIVNEPASYMTAKKLSETIVELGKKYGFKTEVLDKGKIESLKMGGIIAVNRGSAEPPTLTIMEYSPENSINEKPIVLVGKGLVFDTGGINLKPSGSLETMKSDKAGAAAVIGLFCAVAMAKLPLKL
ncbi:MAG TPA: peptidase M17, partial [Bacteroidales bacterium]|nr:peptidase M17 [Bacteroidales bacterium]